MTDGTVESLNRPLEKIVKAYSFYKEEEEHAPPKLKVILIMSWNHVQINNK